MGFIYPTKLYPPQTHPFDTPIKNPIFLFYTTTFQKYPQQFIYYTPLFYLNNQFYYYF